jgi:hypothetical protein
MENIGYTYAKIKHFLQMYDSLILSDHKHQLETICEAFEPFLNTPVTFSSEYGKHFYDCPMILDEHNEVDTCNCLAIKSNIMKANRILNIHQKRIHKLVERLLMKRIENK